MHLSCLPFLYKTLKSSRDGFNVLGNFNVSGIKTAISFSVVQRSRLFVMLLCGLALQIIVHLILKY